MAGARPSSFTLTRPGPLRLYSTTELLRLPPPTWLIDDALPAGGLVGLYGAPGSAKTFVAIDFAMSVATGRPWQGKPVKRGSVLYIAAEGGAGIAKRAQAWLSEHGATSRETLVMWLTEAIQVNNDTDGVNHLLARIEEVAYAAPSLIIIDTLARCFDGDENQQEDMGRFIAGVDRVRKEMDSTVIIVHHTRLGADRERGSTAFRGAADTMIHVQRPDKHEPIVLSCDKQKDAEEFEDLAVQLKVVPVTLQGVMDSSCVIVADKLEKAEIIRRILIHGALPFTDLRDQAKAHGLPPTSLKRTLLGLTQNGKIIKENKEYRWLDE